MKAGEGRRGEREGRGGSGQESGTREERMERGGGEHENKGDELRRLDGYRKDVLRLMEQSD